GIISRRCASAGKKSSLTNRTLTMSSHVALSGQTKSPIKSCNAFVPPSDCSTTASVATRSNGDSAFSHCSKCRTEHSDGQVWSGYQNQTVRSGHGRKSECRAVWFLGEQIENPQTHDSA